jgi:outer membrane protein TolC
MRYWCILGLVLGIWVQSWAQSNSDTLPVLGWGELSTLILEEHPLAQSARLNLERGELLVRGARGFFDPKLMGEWDQKAFKNDNYFRVLDAGIKMALPYGPRISVGYQFADGINLNPALTVPRQGQALIGVELPLLQGLIFDPGRAGVQQARLEQAGLEAEQRLMINDLLFRGVGHYLNWVVAENRLRLMENALSVTFNRHQAIVESFLAGELAGVDTLESFLQVQTRDLDVQQARLGTRKAALDLQNFIWGGNGNVPLTYSAPNLNILGVQENAGFPQLPPDITPLRHPKIAALDAKAGVLNVEERLGRQSMLPQLDVNYYVLGTGFEFAPIAPIEGGAPASVFAQNYKWGATLSWPILMRKGSAKQQMAQIKQEQNAQNREATFREIENKVAAFQQELSITQEQIALFESAVDNYQRLLEAEVEKFRLGDSSIFLINSREQKLVDSRDKLLALYGKYYLAQTGIVWAAGQLGN